jgi:hypothetical protein
VRLAALVVAGLLLGGCGGSKSSPQPNAAETVIRGWTMALYEGKYERAANYFAPRAIIQQQKTFILKTHAEAVFFGQTLPCRAQVTGIETEPKKGTLVATFKLFPGFHGTCPDGGTAKVRFFIRNGKIETWRQLPTAPTAPGQSV